MTTPVNSSDFPQQYRAELDVEARRIEEDVLHTEKGHFEAGQTWRRWFLGIGIAATASGTVGATVTTTFSPSFGAFLAGLAGVLAAVQTFLKPGERSERHRLAGTRYSQLRGQIRRFINIDNQLALEPDKARAELEEISQRKAKLDLESPDIPRPDYERGKRNIHVGEAEYRVDRERMHPVQPADEEIH